MIAVVQRYALYIVLNVCASIWHVWQTLNYDINLWYETWSHHLHFSIIFSSQSKCKKTTSKWHAVIALFSNAVPDIFINTKSRDKRGLFTHRPQMCAPSRDRILGHLLCYWTPLLLCYIGYIFVDPSACNRASRPHFLWFLLASCSSIDHLLWNKAAKPRFVEAKR